MSDVPKSTNEKADEYTYYVRQVFDVLEQRQKDTDL